jgi:hypothetical protein
MKIVANISVAFIWAILIVASGYAIKGYMRQRFLSERDAYCKQVIIHDWLPSGRGAFGVTSQYSTDCYAELMDSPYAPRELSLSDWLIGIMTTMVPL